MKRLIIGTAGHIDHGKTTLVRALTGANTDRLQEEKKRGISIELGFAPFTLPNGQQAAIVDVPGHERFVRHMMAGAFGIDMVLFTIAADEGVMPQTREHMDIIELLGVDQGVVVITKKDIVDEEWLLLMEEEVQEYIDQSILKGAPILSVSSVTGEGIPELLQTIVEVADTTHEKPVFGPARLPIDRVFTIAGFGTVVTGTLWSGQLKIGDTVELMPIQRQVRIRNLQVHNEKVEQALAGQRVAVNLQGIEVADIKRGYVLSTPGQLTPSYRVDTRLHLLPGSPRELENWNRIRFHLGTDETLGRVVLLDRDELLPGEEAYAQIVMEKPVVACKGDPFIIRYYSPVTTIGGGSIIDPVAPRQKRFREEILNELAVKEEGSLSDVILHELEAAGIELLTLDELSRRTGASQSEVKEQIAVLLKQEQAIEISSKGSYYFSSLALEQIYEQMQAVMQDYLNKYPLRQGYPKEDMRSRHFKQLNSKEFNAIIKFMEEKKMLTSNNNMLAPADYTPRPGKKQQEALQQIQSQLKKQLFNPPSVEEISQELGLEAEEARELFAYLLDQGQAIKAGDSMLFSMEAVEEGQKLLNDYFAQEKELTLADFRDLLNTTRK
ncbi:MAG TPA: selenocysteine-specific translation elongation factor, partial [Syntrophomonadaceae bacterium]|nr:selenocysteine-specific translation elongation factor [Syntrophomonadaceae bacterium]